MKSVYSGSEKVAEFESYDVLRVGDGKPAFIYEGNELVYPNPVKDGLVLWYDFSGRTNADGQRGIAEDLSGNGNHGTLQNFNFTPESGYDKNKLLFDGVDDRITTKNPLSNQIPENQSWSLEFILLKDKEHSNNTYLLSGINIGARLMWSDSASKYRVLNYVSNSFDAYLYSSYLINPSNVSQIVLSYDYKTKETKTVINGLQETKINTTEIVPNGMEPNISINLGGGEIYSFKIYNRPLTPEEVAHNYEIEKERFGIE